MVKVSEIKIKSKVDWNSINWRKIQLRVWRIQRKIYEYSKRNEKTEVTRLQKVLVNLLETKLLAVRKVTQDNRGKKTAGVDGVRLLAPTKRFQLANSLKIDGRCKPGDVIEIDHIVPKASGGANHYGNLQAVHGHCHDQKL